MTVLRVALTELRRATDTISATSAIAAIAALTSVALLLGGCSFLPGSDPGDEAESERAAYTMSVDCPDAPAEGHDQARPSRS